MSKAMVQMRKIEACAQCDYMGFPGEYENKSVYPSTDDDAVFYCTLASQKIEENGSTDFSDRVPTWCPLPDWGKPLGGK